MLKICEQDVQDHIDATFAEHPPIHEGRVCAKPYHEVVVAKVDKAEVAKKYFGAVRCNPLGGGCVEPSLTFSMETTDIMTSPIKRRIDVGAVISEEQARLRKIREILQPLTAEPRTGPSKEPSKLFLDKLHSGRTLAMSKYERQLRTSHQKLRKSLALA